MNFWEGLSYVILAVTAVIFVAVIIEVIRYRVTLDRQEFDRETVRREAQQSPEDFVVVEVKDDADSPEQRAA